MCWNDTKRDGDESVDSITRAFELKLELHCNQSADVKLTKECVVIFISSYKNRCRVESISQAITFFRQSRTRYAK